MTLTHFVIFVCVVYLAIVAGRMSMKNDMRRRFESIEEQGQSLRTVGDVINCILQLRDSVESLESEKKALTNSLNIARAGSEKLERDYKTLMAQMKEKREVSDAKTKVISLKNEQIKELEAKNKEMADKLNKWMSKLWELVSAINANACEQRNKQGEYCFFMNKARCKIIYATELLNKSHLLSIGKVEVQKNGSLKYSEGSRSLGNYASKENWGWTNDLNPLRVLPKMNQRESKPIALITHYTDYQNLTKKFAEVLKTSSDVINDSAKMLKYMCEIKEEFTNTLSNK